MKNLFSFVAEGLVVVFVVAVLLCGLLVGDPAAVQLKPSVWSLAIIALLVIVLTVGSPIVRMGINATIDLLLKQRVTREGVITDIIPYERSTFAEKWVKPYVRGKPESAYVLLCVHGVPLKLIAVSSPVEKGKKVRVCFGRFSRVIINIEAMIAPPQ